MDHLVSCRQGISRITREVAAQLGSSGLGQLAVGVSSNSEEPLSGVPVVLPCWACLVSPHVGSRCPELVLAPYDSAWRKETLLIFLHCENLRLVWEILPLSSSSARN